MTQQLFKDIKQAAQQPMNTARCLPLGAYHDLQVHNEEILKVFHDDWIFVCCENQLSEKGQFFALEIAGEQIALLRSRDNNLRALSNICRHRGTPLLDIGFGHIKENIVCPYHAWTYDDEGTFKGAPFSEGSDINVQDHCLPHFRIAIWHSLIFVNLNDQGTDFTDKIAGLDKYLAHYNLASFKHHYQATTEHWHTNWKLAVENGIESYHLFKVHKQTLEQSTPTKNAFYVAGNANWTLTSGLINSPVNKLLKWFAGDYPEAHNHYLLLFLPPSFIAIITYDGIHWIHALPIDATHCSISAAGFYDKKIGKNNTADNQFTAAFLKEDQDICERVQRGMYSTKSQGGKLVKLEQILVDFHQYLAQKLFSSEVDSFQETEQAKIFLKD